MSLCESASAAAGRGAVPALVLTALLWSSGGLAIKLAGLPPLALAGGRSALSALTLVLIFRGRLDFRLRPGREGRMRLGAAACYAGMLILNVAATKLTTAANAILLAYTAPVYVALFAPRLLGERTRPSDWLFVAATLCGMGLFFLDRLTPAGLWGSIAAAASGACYAGFTLFMRGQKDGSPVESAVLGHILAACVGLPALAADVSALAEPRTMAGLAYLGVIQQGASLALYAWSIKRTAALQTILVLTLEPILNPVWVALGVGELPGPWACVGGGVVLAAVTLRSLTSARTARAERSGQGS